eukprot:7333499-Lingulodinium_polyedra.AAC.1
MTHSGGSRPTWPPRNHSRPMRAKACSWSASATAGRRAKSGWAAASHRAATGSTAGPNTARQNV